MNAQASPSSAITNIIALIAIAIGGLFLADYLTGLLGLDFGFTGRLLCAALPPITMIASTAATVLVVIGVVMVALSGPGTGVPVIAGGLFVAGAPTIVLHYIGAGVCPV